MEGCFQQGNIMKPVSDYALMGQVTPNLLAENTVNDGFESSETAHNTGVR